MHKNNYSMNFNQSGERSSAIKEDSAIDYSSPLFSDIVKQTPSLRLDATKLPL